MRKACFLAAVLAIAGCGSDNNKSGGGKIDYVYSYNKALDQAAEEGKNVALFFTGPN